MIYAQDLIINVRPKDRATGVYISNLDDYADIRIFVYGKSACLIQKFDTLDAVGFKLMTVTPTMLTIKIDRSNTSIIRDLDKIRVEILLSLTDADFQDGIYIQGGVATIGDIRPLSDGTRI